MKKGKKILKVSATRLTTTNRVVSIRKSPMRNMINDRLKKLNMSRYDLAKAVGGKVSEQAVYTFLSGKRDMTSGLVWHLLKAVGLEIRPKE